MPHYVGLDVSQKTTSICVVNEQGRRLWRGVCQGSRINLTGDDPEHVVVVPGGLFAPTAKADLTAAISGDEVEGDFA
jgi:hypothetical protein